MNARLALALTAALWPVALAHGESAKVNLRGAVPCLDSSSVRVKLVDVPAARQGALRGVGTAVNRELAQALRAGGVRHETRTSCQGRPAPTRVQIEVRYLDPKQYVGFGDPAYSYTFRLAVGPGAGKPPVQFTSSWGEIHSEGRTGRSVASVLTNLSRTQAQDLVRAWRRDNPGARGGS